MLKDAIEEWWHSLGFKKEVLMGLSCQNCKCRYGRHSRGDMGFCHNCVICPRFGWPSGYVPGATGVAPIDGYWE